MVTEALCAENCTARWVWKTGELLHGAQVPWEVQAINTCPENFLWEKNKGVIILAAPGLYQLQMGFYSNKTPTAKIYINGEVVLTLKSQGRATASKHSAGNIAGLTLNEYVALPARARLAVAFEGESVGEGFLSLRKL